MLRPTLAPSVLLAVTTGAVAIAPAATDAANAANWLNAQEAAFLNRINTYRASKGRGKLVATRSLNAASYKHSLDMGRNEFFSHTGSNGSSPWQRMAAEGYTFNTAKAENIAAGYGTAQAVFNGWKNSSGHNKNMLNPNYKAIGIGRATVSGSPYTTYWTTDFGGVIDAKPVC
jgi:uncharacterized protein YkwD